MKPNVILSCVLAVMEGGLAGAYFCRAGQTKEKKPKVLLYIVSALWFALSVLDGTEGARALQKDKTTEINGGNDHE